MQQLSLIHQFGFPHLGMKELLKHIGTLVIISVGLVERSAVSEQASHVGNKQMFVDIVMALQPVTYRLQI